MTKSTMDELLEKVEKASSFEDKVAILQQNRAQPLVDLLQGVFDDRIKWLLPEGPVPFKPSRRENIEGALWTEIRKLYLFVQGGNPNLSQVRREQLFIELCESIDPRDARLLEAVKDRKLPYPSITVDLFRAAYPDVYIEHNALETLATEPPKPKRQRKAKEKKSDVQDTTLE